MSIDPKKFMFLAKVLLIKTSGTVLSMYESDFFGSKGWKPSERSSAVRSSLCFSYSQHAGNRCSTHIYGIKNNFVRSLPDASQGCFHST